MKVLGTGRSDGREECRRHYHTPRSRSSIVYVYHNKHPKEQQFTGIHRHGFFSDPHTFNVEPNLIHIISISSRRPSAAGNSSRQFRQFFFANGYGCRGLPAEAVAAARGDDALQASRCGIRRGARLTRRRPHIVHQYNSNNNQRFCTAAAEVTRYIQTDGGARCRQRGRCNNTGERGRYATIFVEKYHDVGSAGHRNATLDGR